MTTNTAETKKIWITPKLVVHGDVVQITTEAPVSGKKHGASDGATMGSDRIFWAS